MQVLSNRLREIATIATDLSEIIEESTPHEISIQRMNELLSHVANNFFIIGNECILAKNENTIYVRYAFRVS